MVNAPVIPVAPTVAITSPVSGASFTAPASLTVTANATDTDGTIVKVEFYNGATKLGEDLTSPYTFAWSNVAAGSYNLTAVATDNAGLNATSSAVQIYCKRPSISSSNGCYYFSNYRFGLYCPGQHHYKRQRC